MPEASDIATPLIAPPETARILVESGMPVSEVQSELGSRQKALTFYAEALEGRYTVRRAGTLCVVCGDQPRDRVVRCEWRAFFTRFSLAGLFHLLLGHISLPIRSDSCQCTTYHAFCERCWRTARRGRLWGRFLEFLSFASLLFGLFLAPLGGLGAFYLNRLKATETAELIATCVVGVGLFALSMYLGRFSQRLCVIPSMRKIAPVPFLLQSISSVKSTA